MSILYPRFRLKFCLLGGKFGSVIHLNLGLEAKSLKTGYIPTFLPPLEGIQSNKQIMYIPENNSDVSL